MCETQKENSEKVNWQEKNLQINKWEKLKKKRKLKCIGKKEKYSIGKWERRSRGRLVEKEKCNDKDWWMKWKKSREEKKWKNKNKLVF